MSVFLKGLLAGLGCLAAPLVAFIALVVIASLVWLLTKAAIFFWRSL